MIENLPVPVDRRVWQEARALRDAGYRVSVICPKGAGFEKSRETLEGIEIYRYRALGGIERARLFPRVCLGPGGISTRFARLRANPLSHASGLQSADTIFLIALFFKLFGVRFIFDHHDLESRALRSKFERRDLGYKLVAGLSA